MKFVVLLICTSIGSVLSIPGKRHHPAAENVYNTNIVSEEEATDLHHKILKKSIKAPSTEHEDTPEGTAQEPCRLTLPTMDLTAIDIPQDPYSDYEIQDILPTEVVPPRIPSFSYNIPFNKWTPYSLDYLIEEPAQDYRTTYNSYNMPFIYSNPVPSVRSLPPVVSTHIHETIPEIPEIPEIEDGYDVEDFTDRQLYFPPYVRAVRSRNDDFLDQLEKDATMPNILPTMPFPYMRAANPINYQALYNPSYKPYSKDGSIAVFQGGSVSDCALPFLLSCSPKISYGTLTNDNDVLPAPVTYRKDSGVGPTHRTKGHKL